MNATDAKLESLKAAARRSAEQNCMRYCVANLNLSGARLLVVRPLSDFEAEPERVVYMTPEAQL